MPHDNPLGLDGFEFVEFTSPDPEALGRPLPAPRLRPSQRSQIEERAPLCAGGHQLHPQHGASGHAEDFRGAHGPSASAMAFRVDDSEQALALAVERGATAGRGRYGLPAIEGIGGSYLYLVDLYGAQTDLRPRFRAGRGGAEATDEVRPPHARPPHPQCPPRPDGSLGAILRKDLQLPPDPLFRHRGSADRLALARDDRARRQDPHTPQRKPGRVQPDRGVPEGI